MTATHAPSRRLAVLIAAALATTACADAVDVDEDGFKPEVADPAPTADYERDTPSVNPPEDTDADDCNARLATPYIGEKASAATRGELLSAVAPVVKVRWLGPDDMATTDFVPDRLNVRLDGNDTIQEVSCG